ncbi:PE family protein [Mycobacterium sp.]|uniref:PE family protein n=1 Tax=Mycobacterium sp. TaxID=1785 RepID=UPI003F9B80CE
MSFVLAVPEALAAAASDVAGIGSTLSAASTAAAGPTTGVLAAAGDEVSAQIAALFSEHGLGYQQLSARVSAFHEQFVQALTAGTSAYAAAEANIAQTLANAVGAPAAGGKSGIGGVLSNAASQVENALSGNGGVGLLSGGSGLLARGAQEIGAVSQAGGLLLQPTGGIRALTSAAALLSPAAMTAAAALTPAANALAPIGQAIEAAYLAFEPYVQYAFQLAEYAVRYLPWIGWLAPQITFFYNLFEPMVQAALFNTIDVLTQTITLSQGLSNFWAATTASINQFIVSEAYWIRSFLPPLPPLPPFFP